MGFVRALDRASASRRPRPLPRPTPPSRCRAARCPRAARRSSRCSGAVKRFGGLVAVNDVSFEVSAGEIVGLIGPNGAGKSTMFNLLTGTLPMTAGPRRVPRPRHHRHGAAARSRGCGMARTFQHVKLRPHMSLLDNVALGAHARTRAGVLAAGLRLDRAEEAQILPRRSASSSASASASARTSWPAACRWARSASSRSRARSRPIRCCWCSTSRPPACAARKSRRSATCCASCATRA